MDEKTHIRPLTAVRFFAAMWVVLYHYWPKLAVDGTPAIVTRGYLGVELFFVLSGFILCHVYLPPAERGEFRYKSFLWARIARIYPLHIATLLGVGVMAIGAGLAGFSIDSAILSWASLPANLLMVHAWGLAPEAGWNHPSWSISAEWFAYLCFPLFAWAAMRLKGRPLVAVTAASGLLAGLYLVFPMFAGHPLTEATIAWGALRIVPSFALGCAAYLLWRSGTFASPRWMLGVSAGLVAVIIAMAALGANDIPLVLTFGALIVALAGLSASGSGAVSHPLLVWLGEISYAVYMVCVPWKLLFVNGASKLFDLPEQLPLGLWLVFLLGVIPIAAAAHHLIEKPARNALRSLARRRAARPKFA